MSTPQPDTFTARFAALVAQAVAGLDPDDRAERIAYCRANDAHGVRTHTGTDGLIEITWGGRKLALVAAADLEAGVALEAEFIAEEAPDTVPPEWQE